MKILDIDMDFFLDNVAVSKSFDGIRLEDEYYSPWDIADVRNFLEDNCGLSTERKKRVLF